MQILKGRIEIEGNVVSCLFKDMLLIDDTELSKSMFVTSDSLFYFSLINDLRKKGFYSLDEITILSNSTEAVIERFNACGGWETIQNQIDIINDKNFDVYVDILYRENTIKSLYDDGFNLLKKVKIKDNEVAPLTLFRKMTNEEVLDWYDARISAYEIAKSSSVLCEEEVDFDDQFFDDCKEGLENGVPFDTAGFDINNEEINCFPFLSNQTGGLLPGTFTMLGGFSGCGKSTWFVTAIMSLLSKGRKVLIISNEENIKKFKVKFLVWMLGKRNRYFKLTKKKLTSGDIDNISREQLSNVQKYWKENYKGNLKFIQINDSNMTIAKKKIRENALRYGYDTVLYDTFKISQEDMSGQRQDLALVRDSRELDKLGKKYNLIMLASVQLAESLKGKLFLDSSVLSNSKQIKEVLEGLFLMRSVYAEELDSNNKKHFCRPFRLKKINDKWIEEEYHPDPDGVYRMLFCEKTRSGNVSSDTGVAYLLKFDGNYSIFRETAQCRPKHGSIV